VQGPGTITVTRGSELRECPMAGEANWGQASPGLRSDVERQRVQ
jgi:hypothetical protein